MTATVERILLQSHGGRRPDPLERVRRRVPALLAIVCLTIVAAACGDGGGGPPRPTPTPTPITPTPGSVAAMRLDAPGVVTSVNTREWIAVVDPEAYGQVGQGRIVLPLDAGPDAGPVPRPGCRWTPPLDPECQPDGHAVAVGESEWIYAYGTEQTPSGFDVPVQNAAGPEGEVFLLLGFGLDRNAQEIRPAPPARFIGTIGGTGFTRIPVLWRTPLSGREPLPADGFADGPRPYQADARGRIVGAGVDPQLPVLWREGADGAFSLERLPLLDGGTRGGALGIDGDVIAGFSDEGQPSSHAVVWVERDGVFVPHELPVPDDVRRCTHAVAVSGPYVAGDCVVAASTHTVGVVWRRIGETTWAVHATLRPLDGDDDSTIVGLAGTLAAGASQRSGTSTPVAWRIASAGGS